MLRRRDIALHLMKCEINEGDAQSAVLRVRCACCLLYLIRFKRGFLLKNDPMRVIF